MALMCGEAYTQSARMAQVKGTFAGYTTNTEAMLGVMQMHRDAVEEIDRELVPPALVAGGSVGVATRTAVLVAVTPQATARAINAATKKPRNVRL